MSETPVIFLAFANSQDAHLSMLKRESDNLNRALESSERKGRVKVHRDESADVESVFHSLSRYGNEIAVFHYGGHADGANLHFEGGTANAAGIVDYLSTLPDLKLVFLNGCSTLGQVEYMMEKGIKAVIATSTPIEDSKATEFSEHFYRALANNNTIKNSFTFAASFLKTKYGNMTEPVIKNHRGLRLRRDNTREEMPWGLYLNDGGDSILTWTLPNQFSPKKYVRPQETEYEVNEFIYPILDEMAYFNKELEEEIYDEDGEPKIDDREYLLKIIGNFPWPIGSQIRRLVSNDDELNKATVIRLKQIISTYVITGQLLYYILLSQVWDERRKSGFIPKTYIINALSMNADSFSFFDYFANIRQILEELKTTTHKLFVPEFEGILEGLQAKEELYDAYLFLESLRSKIAGDQDVESNIWQTCADAEYALSTVLIKAAFLAKYQMVTVRNITITNPRHREASFNHYIGKLHATAGDLLNLERKPITYEGYTDSRSVLLVKNLEDVSTYLNLSPFIIDKNAFGDAKSPATDLYMYAYQEDREYMYVISQHNIYKALIDKSDRIHTGMEEKNEVQTKSRRGRGRRGRGKVEAKRPYAVLKEQFELFKKDLSN